MEICGDCYFFTALVGRSSEGICDLFKDGKALREVVYHDQQECEEDFSLSEKGEIRQLKERLRELEGR